MYMLQVSSPSLWTCSRLPGEFLGLCVTCAACGALSDGVTQVTVADEGASGVLALPTQADVWAELTLINIFKTNQMGRGFLSLKIRTIYSDQKRTHVLLTSPEEDLVSILHIGLVMFLPKYQAFPFPASTVVITQKTSHIPFILTNTLDLICEQKTQWGIFALDG